MCFKQPRGKISKFSRSKALNGEFAKKKTAFHSFPLNRKSGQNIGSV